MFWKKKKIFDVELDARHNDNRAAYRIAPERSRPVIITIMGNAFHALNISGTDVAFRSHNFPVGTRTPATIRLPSEDRIFPVVLEVVAKQRDLCRCSFREIHEDAENLLHLYLGYKSEKSGRTAGIRVADRWWRNSKLKVGTCRNFSRLLRQSLELD